MISRKAPASIRVRFAEAPHRTRRRTLPRRPLAPILRRDDAQRAGDWHKFVPATIVLSHIQKLRNARMGYRAITAAAGLAKSIIAMILTVRSGCRSESIVQ